MKKNDLILLDLIKKSQFGSSEQLDCSDVDWDALFTEASQQSVLGLIAPEIPNEFTSGKWIEVDYRQKSAYIRYCHAQDELKLVMDTASIPFVIIKGNASAVSYTNPYRRSMGDIDFIVPKDLYIIAKEVLSSSGYLESHDNGRHAAYRKDNQLFELHHHFSGDDLDIEEYISKGIFCSEFVVIDRFEFPILPKLVNGLVLLDHLRSHLKSSVGLRQVIDWMMYVYRNLDDDFWNNEFKTVVEELGLVTFAITITRMCQIYLGLPENISWCKSADEKVCEQLIECVLATGNFGRKNGQGRNVEVVSTKIKQKGLFPWLQSAGKRNWKTYHNHHWLKPFCWLYQAFRYAKQGFKTGRNTKQIKQDFDRSKERYELLKKMGIE